MSDAAPVLVTGATGYVGGLAVEALARRGARVIGVDVRPPRTAPPAGVEMHELDVRSPRLAELIAERGADRVVHLAAIVTPPPGMGEDELRDVEVGGTERVLAACLEGGATHLTVTSSGAAYGYEPSNRGRLLTEDDELHGHPRFAYARHKREVEELLARAREEHPQLGQLVLRPGTILGAGASNQITALFDAPVMLTLRGSAVPWVFIWDRDVAEVIATGVCERRTGVYNLAGEGVVTQREIARMQGKPIVPLPPGVVRGALGLLARVGRAPYGPEQVDFLRYRPVLDAARLRRDFPPLAKPTSREVIEHYLEGRGG